MPGRLRRAVALVPTGNVRPVSSRSAAAQRWRPSLSRSVHLLREFRYEQPDPARFYTAIAERLGRPAVAVRRPRRRGLPRRGRRPGLLPRRVLRRRRDVPRPRRGRRRARRAGHHRRGHGDRLGDAAAVPDGRARRLLLLQRPRARPRPVADGRGDGPGHPARAARSSSATRPGGARGAATRPRRGTSSAAAAPAGGTPRSTATSRRTSTASPCSRSPSARGSAGPPASRTPRSSRCSRATTRGGPGGCCACPSCGRW